MVWEVVKILSVERIRLVITPKTDDQQICSLTCWTACMGSLSMQTMQKVLAAFQLVLLCLTLTGCAIPIGQSELRIGNYEDPQEWQHRMWQESQDWHMALPGAR